MGSALGGILSTRHEVTLVGRRENMDAVREHGLRLSGEVNMVARVNARETVEGMEEPDLIVLTTKAYHTRAVVDALRLMPWAKPSVITFQNGLGNLEVLRGWKGSMAFGGTTTIGANLPEPGAVRISGLGLTVVGSDLDVEGARRIADAIDACGPRVEIAEDIHREIWSKAIVNACINPLTAILKVPNGRLLDSQTICHLMSDVCEECESVARAAGVLASGYGVFERVKAVARDTAENRSSMLRDIETGRRTEISHINGMICKTGSHHEVAVPLNRALVNIVRALEKG